MQITISKALSLLVVGVYGVVAFSYAGLAGLKWCLGLLAPLAFIWFPEEIGVLTGYFQTGYVNVQTPGKVVSFLGWLFLVGVPVLLWFLFGRAR